MNKPIPESLKLEFTLAMRELEAEVQKQKQEKETLRQAIREGFSKKKMEDPEYLDLKDLQFLSALAKQSKEKKKEQQKKS